MPKTDQFITLTVLILNQWILKTYHRMTSLCSYTSNQKMCQLIYNEYNGLVTCDKHVLFNITAIFHPSLLIARKTDFQMLASPYNPVVTTDVA